MVYPSPTYLVLEDAFLFIVVGFDSGRAKYPQRVNFGDIYITDIDITKCEIFLRAISPYCHSGETDFYSLNMSATATSLVGGIYRISAIFIKYRRYRCQILALSVSDIDDISARYRQNKYCQYRKKNFVKK